VKKGKFTERCNGVLNAKKVFRQKLISLLDIGFRKILRSLIFLVWARNLSGPDKKLPYPDKKNK
jgi:hypothetical protein